MLERNEPHSLSYRCLHEIALSCTFFSLSQNTSNQTNKIDSVCSSIALVLLLCIEFASKNMFDGARDSNRAAINETSEIVFIRVCIFLCVHCI